MVVNARPLKRTKKRVTADLHDFRTFPPPAAAAAESDPFRAAVRRFLSRYARLPPPSSVLSPAAAPHLLTWRVSFRVDSPPRKPDPASPSSPFVLDLDVVEEDVARSRSVYCDHCRVVGWSGHPVCGKRYHFIIRNDLTSLTQSDQACVRCGSALQFLDTRCATCNHEMTADDVEDWAYLQLGDASHLLHGVVHSNGYGHLLRINGREGGSRVLTGSDVMGFWDRLCRSLRVRKVTVMDKSKKHGLEYRLLHAVTEGRSWYGNWGYVFGAGSFGLTAEAYKRAADSLAGIPLSVFFSHARSRRTPLQDTVALYCALAGCTAPVRTVGELFAFVVGLLREPGGPAEPAGVLSAWTRADVARVEAAMVKILRADSEPGHWVPWRALKGAVFRKAEPPLLVDYCLQGLAGKPAGDGRAVAARCNPDTRAVEFRLEAAGFPSESRPDGSQVLRDLRFLYEALLNPGTMHEYRPRPLRQAAMESAMRLLDCKQFIKDYDEPPGATAGSAAVRVWVQAELDQTGCGKHAVAPPAELLVLPAAATVADLKAEAARAFRETYLALQRFEVERLAEFGQVADRTPVRLLVGPEGAVRVRGRCGGDPSHRLGQFRMERGTENWTVDCSCGAKDDDGERMMACDACGVWQHTRCSGIEDAAEVPSRFVCRRCSAQKRPTGPPGKRCKYSKNEGLPGRCSANAPLLDGAGGGYIPLTQVQ
ncbi:RING/FYVE/PHD zinc finger superfamily protein [Wolffia australiana]